MSRSAVVADDDPSMRLLVTLNLERNGFAVAAEAATGAAAIAAAGTSRPNLMVLDHLMPEMTGAAAVPAIRAASPTTVIIMFSATPPSTRPDGVDVFVSKEGGVAALLVAVGDLKTTGRFD